MKPTSAQFAQFVSMSQQSSLQPSVKQAGEEDFYARLQQIWNKILLLEEVGFIENENDKFQYAYRLVEIELQKLCTECISLQQRINEMSAH